MDHDSLYLAAGSSKQDIFNACTERALTFLDSLIPDVLVHAADALFVLAEEARSNVEQTTYLDGLRGIEFHKDAICQSFIDSVKLHLHGFSAHRADINRLRGDAETESWEKDELRILDDHDLAATLAVESMSDKAIIRCTRELHALAVRFGDLFDTGPIPIEINPLSPKMICESFRDACNAIDCELETQQALYKAFERGVIDDLREFYESLNLLLATAGVVPDFNYSFTPENAEDAPPPLPEESPARESESIEPAEAIGHAVAPEDSYPQPPTPGATTSQGGPFEALRERLSSAINAGRTQAPAPSPGYTPTSALIEHLGQMQASLESSPNEPSALSPEQMLQQLTEQTGASPSASDRGTLELLGRMFCQFAVNEQMPTPFQSALSRMQLPYVRASMASPNLLASGQSPARQLLDEVARVGVGWCEQSDRRGEVLGKVNAVVDKVERNSEIMTETHFGDLLTEFREFLDKKSRRADIKSKREREAFEGRQRLRMARQDVSDIIRSQLQEHANLPVLVKDLLQKAWSHVMVLTLLRHGKESPEWQQVKSSLDEMVWTATIEPTRDNVKRLRTRLPVLAKSLARGLRSIGYSEPDIQKLLGNLKSMYQDLVRRTGSDVVTIEAGDDGFTIRGDDLLADVDAVREPIIEDVDTLSTAISQIQQWDSGKWVEFRRDDDTRIRAKLSWVSPITGQYLFVNQAGAKAAECTLHQLAQDLARDRLIPMEESELVTDTLARIQQDIDGQQQPTLH